MNSNNDQVWELNYQKGRYNTYPFDEVVSFILSQYSKAPDRKKVRVLDLGSGGGNNTRFLCAEGFDVFAVDGSESSVQLTNEVMQTFGMPLQSHLADFKQLPFQSELFDCIIDRQSIGHNSGRDIDQIIGEVYRVLKPGGYYFGFLLSSNHPHKNFGKPLDVDGDMNHFSAGSLTQSGLVHFFSIPEIEQRYKMFSIEEIVVRNSKALKAGLESRYNDEYFIVIGKK